MLLCIYSKEKKARYLKMTEIAKRDTELLKQDTIIPNKITACSEEELEKVTEETMDSLNWVLQNLFKF
jgi:DNA topoisomerase IA